MTNEPIYTIKPSYIPRLVFWGIIGFGILVVNLLNGYIWQGIFMIGVISPIALLDIWLWRISATYYIYDNMIVSKTGILTMNKTKIAIADIRGVSMKQTFFGGLFNYGDVAFGTAATAGAEVIMKSVDKPEIIESLFEN